MAKKSAAHGPNELVSTHIKLRRSTLEALKKSAKGNYRSQNAEIVSVIDSFLSLDGAALAIAWAKYKELTGTDPQGTPQNLEALLSMLPKV